jgi:hypothetical protein
MKQLFRKIANFFRFSKNPKPNFKVEAYWNKAEKKVFLKESSILFDTTENTQESTDESTQIKVSTNVEIEKIVSTSKPTLPTDANKIQVLDKKYNNPNTIYRNNKGRFASLK